MQHMMSTMSTNVSHCGDNVWYVDLGASNHMTNHGQWFKDMQILDNRGYVETDDDTLHPIAHTGNCFTTNPLNLFGPKGLAILLV